MSSEFPMLQFEHLAVWILNFTGAATKSVATANLLLECCHIVLTSVVLVYSYSVLCVNLSSPEKDVWIGGNEVCGFHEFIMCVTL